MSETVVSYEGGLRCRAEHAGSGTGVPADAPKDHHGRGEGISLGSRILGIMAITARSMDREIAGATAAVTIARNV